MALPSFRLARTRLLVHVILALAVLPSAIALAEVGAAPMDLTAGWEYRWGDSPFDANGVPTWTRAASNADAWRPIAFPSNPPDRNGLRNVWYRLPLPDGSWRDPAIYIYSVDLNIQAYLDGKKIYQFGTFDEYGQGRFEGWPWHMISLPTDFQGKYIYFRVFSNYHKIGLWGQIKIMERLDLIHHVFNSSKTQIIVSCLSLLIALLAALIAAIQSTERRSYLLISLFSLAASLFLLADSQIKQLLLNAPLVWSYIGYIVAFTVPVVMALLFRQWCRPPWTRVMVYVAVVHGVFAVGAITGSLLTWLDLSTAVPVFEGMLMISLAVLFGGAFAHLRVSSAERRVAIVSFAVFSLFLLIELGVSHDLLPWTRLPVAWGLLIFSLMLIALALRHFAKTQRDLQTLNTNLEHMVRERTRDLERSNADLRQFAYVISHDLQEPLRMVVSYLQLLQRRHADRLDATGHEYITFAVGGAKRMSDMILGLLEFSRIDTQGQAFQTMSLADAADDALRNLDVVVQTSGAIVRLGDLPAVRADPSQVRSLLQNLIGNALKYRAPDRTPVIRLDIEDTADGRVKPAGLDGPANDAGAPQPMVILAIADNGIGIDPAFHARVFRVFERLHGPHQYGGTGIGLAVCKRIVDRHGGHIWIDSTPGVGTTVRFTLPAVED